MAEKLIDMHMHTYYSDGDLSPNKLIEKALKNNIGTMAITDHNTIEGLRNFDNSYKDKIEIINGIELSAKSLKGTMHVLGYDIDIENKSLNDKMHELKNNSFQREISLIEQLKKDYEIEFDYQDIINLLNSNHNLGRPDLAKLLIKYGKAKTVNEAFEKYLVSVNKKIKGINKELDYNECIDLILKSGGIPVLAHPKSLKLNEEELASLLEKMKLSGLMGIEVYHPTHNEEERKLFLKLANKYDFLISGGTDYHGEVTKPDIEIGTGKNNNIKIKKISLLDEIRNRR